MDVVPNLLKCPVSVLMLYRTYPVSGTGNTGGIYRRNALERTVPNKLLPNIKVVRVTLIRHTAKNPTNITCIILIVVFQHKVKKKISTEGSLHATYSSKCRTHPVHETNTTSNTSNTVVTSALAPTKPIRSDQPLVSARSLFCLVHTCVRESTILSNEW